MPKLVAHTIVKNESRFIWYSLMSVLNYVDEIIVGNHGSTDNTIEIIKYINSPKIKIYDFSHIPDDRYSEVRTAMMAKTQTDWLLILDGDEIWPANAIQNTVNIINTHPDLDFIVQPFYNLVGDVYHYQPESAGKYNLCGYTGHVTIRAINNQNMGGVKFHGAHMQQGMFDANGVLIQNRLDSKFIFQPVKYFHTTHLRRSNVDAQVQKRPAKFKYELGTSFPFDFKYPEIFYSPHPALVKDVWERRNILYNLNALWQTPLRHLHRYMIR